MSKVWRNGVIRDATVEEQKEIDDRQAKAVSERPTKKDPRYHGNYKH